MMEKQVFCGSCKWHKANIIFAEDDLCLIQYEIDQIGNKLYGKAMARNKKYDCKDHQYEAYIKHLPEIIGAVIFLIAVLIAEFWK